MPIKDDSLLDEETLQLIERIGKADIVVGIPSFNNSRTIGHVVRAASAESSGLVRFRCHPHMPFPGRGDFF